GWRIIAIPRTAWRRAPRLILHRRGASRRCARLSAIVEQATEQSTALAPGQLGLEFANAALRDLEGMFLHEYCLRQVIWRSRQTGDLFFDQLFGFPVTSRGAALDIFQPREQAFDGTAVFGIKHVLPPVCGRPSRW